MRHRNRPLDPLTIELHSVRERQARLTVDDLAAALEPSASIADMLAALPKTGSAAILRKAIGEAREAARRERPVAALIGAEVLTQGYSPLIARMIEHDIFQAVCMDGTAALFDFELACFGQTDEDPASAKYGSAREAGETFNQIVNAGVARGFGLGEYLGRSLIERAPRNLDLSILAHAATKQILITVHPRIGAEPIHRHAAADGANLGKGAQRDFLLLAGHLGTLADGGLALDLWSDGLGGVFKQAWAAAVQAASASPAGLRYIRFARETPSQSANANLPHGAELLNIQADPLILPLFCAGVLS